MISQPNSAGLVLAEFYNRLVAGKQRVFLTHNDVQPIRLLHGLREMSFHQIFRERGRYGNLVIALFHPLIDFG